MAWQPTPPEGLIVAELLDGTIVNYSDLKPGDIFRAKLFQTDIYIHPITYEDADDVYCRVAEPPIKNKRQGYAVCMDYGPLAGFLS